MKKLSMLFFAMLFIVCIAAQAFAAITTVNNNFTIINGTGGLTGGTNDVVFTWDLTKKTSVVASGQVSNAALSSTCPFFSVTWSAHDVAIYGPGTYTIFDGCPAGGPDCGTGNAVTFTVGTEQIGLHCLFDWGGSFDIDVVNVLSPNAVFGPSPMCEAENNCGGQATCDANPAATVWSWMSSDWDGDGFNGAGMKEGPFAGFNINFSVNVVGTTNNNFSMINETGGLTGGANDVLFTWNGTKLTSVAASGQVSNAVIASTCPLSGKTWQAHDVAIYGPGAYKVYTGCAPGSPGCGLGTAMTFTVGANELGVHLLLDSGTGETNTNWDVVNVWTPNAVFGPSAMCADANNCGGQATCGRNPAIKVWDWMSKDVDGDGINGLSMVDGQFPGFAVNFNVMAPCPTSCNDNNSCTADSCVGGTCFHTPIVCNDNNICTTDTCNPATGVCVYTNNTLVCSDNNNCTVNDACSNGICAGAPKNCDDNNVCTTDSCIPLIPNGCVNNPNTFPCYDNNACTTGDVCSNKVCAGKPKNCNDNNSCTTDSCDTASGNCVRVLTCPSCSGQPNGTACSDNNACTVNDACSSGACVGTPRTCNDNNVCTTDTCSTLNGCVFTYNTAVCSDSNSCTVGDTCSNGVCKPGVLLNCDDGNVCTNDKYVPVIPQCCVHDPNTVSCNDNNACTSSDKCANAVCTGKQKTCDDSNLCTTNGCDTASGNCQYTPLPPSECSTSCVGKANGSPCTDNNACTVDACNNQVCVGTNRTCNDNNVCTTDTCNTATGCVFTNNTLLCSDNSYCTVNDACSNGICVGASKNCNDNNVCTDDSCVSIIPGGCVNIANTLACNDNNACTTSDVCANKSCKGTPVANGTTCADDTVCNGEETCLSGSCTAGTPLTCNDNNACTSDTCNPGFGCVFTNICNPCYYTNGGLEAHGARVTGYQMSTGPCTPSTACCDNGTWKISCFFPTNVLYKNCAPVWTDVGGAGNWGEKCIDWLNRTNQAGIERRGFYGNTPMGGEGYCAMKSGNDTTYQCIIAPETSYTTNGPTSGWKPVASCSGGSTVSTTKTQSLQ